MAARGGGTVGWLGGWVDAWHWLLSCALTMMAHLIHGFQPTGRGKSMWTGRTGGDDGWGGRSVQSGGMKGSGLGSAAGVWTLPFGGTYLKNKLWLGSGLVGGGVFFE